MEDDMDHEGDRGDRAEMRDAVLDLVCRGERSPNQAADPNSFRLGRAAVAGDLIVAVAEWTATNGARYGGLFELRHGQDGHWRALGGASYGAIGEPRSGRPWAKSGGFANEHGGSFAGWVREPRARRAHVSGPSGRMFDEPVDDGVLLLCWAGAFDPNSMVVEFVDSAGQSVGTVRGA